MSTKQYILTQRELFIKHGIDKIASTDIKQFTLICKDIKTIELNSVNATVFYQLVDSFLNTI